ncbi:MAG: acetolactate synthase [Alcanivorax borkumensis]|jgi:acetolactate synthase-1/2/3 large subunit|uniref:Acetolactate synthase, large subunit n=1 Tax=Alcanivorax borkumensis (strain ATCC 700651 / DSM 11573 / NCIMB 13689 / SK2) TaxID=393595 RepID=Q0VRP6_ALCBS|nr:MULTISPECIES: acetolactate synthase large subunit [Alcanivorax]OJH09031.1 MAG: acetolactate synthase [Alcanivorax borkumensis]EUC69849.1 acetolactate synthase [Alcanivorax sp. 97CO-5]PKG01699.1 acetolactate synthase large subunit [Alcanivorax sp. 97CO-6]CAL16152.1 acetolactate synthase, large subunit [Alcanivorax borkumensis SK2]BAP13575.1 acetolactate synthase [Alcanivorax sp. NBRC 101098]
MKASDLFVRALEAEGVEHVFAIPGEENLDLLESLRGSNIELVITRHEQAAGFMASTYGRLTGKAGVCMSTLGPGATNLVTAAAYAQLGAMPMVMITGQKPIKTSKQGQFQIIDVVDMMRPLTKFTKQVVSGDSIPTRIRESFRLAQEERPGATHLELPEDIAREHSTMPVTEPSATRRPIAEDKAICKAIEAIKGARKPLLLAGAGANRKLTSKMLRQFVEKLGIPVITTQMGKGVVDETGPHFLGNTALSSGDFVHRAIDQADLIINVGHDVVEKPPFFMRPGGAEVVHINFNSAQVDPVYFPQIEVVGDIANSLWQLKERLAPQEHWSFSDFHRIRDALQKHIHEGIQDDSFPIRPQRLVDEIRKIMPEDGILTLDNGMYKIWFARNYPATKPNTVLLDNALATMGAGLPSGMAAKMVHPDRRVMAIVGDGGFMMNSQELETAVRLKLDIVVLILRDDGYGMIKWKQNDMDFQDFGLDFQNPDFVAYARAYGANGHRVESTAGLGPLVEECYQQGGVHVIDCMVDYRDNSRILNREIRELSSKL